MKAEALSCSTKDLQVFCHGKDVTLKVALDNWNTPTFQSVAISFSLICWKAVKACPWELGLTAFERATKVKFKSQSEWEIKKIFKHGEIREGTKD